MEEKKPNTEKDDLLLRLLKDYEERQLEEQPEKELFPSEDFCQRMGKIIENPDNWKKYMRKDRRRVRMLQTQKALALVVMVLMLFLVAVKHIDPVRISASIPSFVFLEGNGINNAVVMKPNSEPGSTTLSVQKKRKELPEAVLGYLPQGFVQEPGDRQNGVYRYISSQGEELFHISVSRFDSGMEVHFAESSTVEQVSIDGKEVFKSEVDGFSVSYLWKEGKYVVDFYFYMIDEAEAEKIIEAVSLSEAGK